MNQKNFCKLCLELKNLRDSHLLPKSLYRIVCTGERNTNPVIMTPEAALQTSKQVRDYLLCDDCELRFNRGGEKYVLDNCFRGEGKFRLRKTLEAHEPKFKIDAGFVYDVSAIQGVDASKILYFAASIFWRASVHRWRTGMRTLDSVSLGDKYEEQFRQYLMGEEEFPCRATVWTAISRSVNPDNVAFVPTKGRQEGYFCHRFSIPGIVFFMYVGKMVPQLFLNMGLPKGGLVYVVDHADSIVRRDSMEVLKTAKPLGRLLKTGNSSREKSDPNDGPSPLLQTKPKRIAIS